LEIERLRADLWDGLFLPVTFVGGILFLLGPLLVPGLLRQGISGWAILVLLSVPLAILAGCVVAALRNLTEVIPNDRLPSSARGLLRWLAFLRAVVLLLVGRIFGGGVGRGGTFGGGGASGRW